MERAHTAGDDGMTLALESALVERLPGFLPSQRWFGGKGRSIRAVRVVDLAWLPAVEGDEVLVCVEVDYNDAAADRYSLWLGVRDTPGEGPAIARLDDAGDMRWVVDAAAGSRAVSGLIGGLAEPGEIPTARGGALRIADLAPEASAALSVSPVVQALGGDQSNTSLRIGHELVFKLFRRMQPGENPELEMLRFLTTRSSFREVPSLRGSVSYVAPDGAIFTVGVLQTWVHSIADGWRYVVSHLERELATPGAWASMRAELFALGATTRGFHQALSSDSATAAFAPKPVQQRDLRLWTAEVAGRAAGVLPRVGHSQMSDDETTRLARVLDQVSSPAFTPVPAIEGAGHRFSTIRIHGDYHLGQTLKTPTGFVLIDFEGEPTRPLDDRRQTHCALKDVAGMLRSFEYAVAVACERAPGREDGLRRAVPMASAFLDGYFGAAQDVPSVFLPAARDDCRQWIRFFELEKAVYELDYELTNRPSWAHIPARAILRILDA
jgi:trehalose synthase-fused probable maltokinase